MKTFNDIYINAEKDKIAKNISDDWRYCRIWFFISLLLILIWPWDASWWLLTIFPITAIVIFIVGLLQSIKLGKKGLDLSGLSGIVSILDRNRER